MKDEKQPPAIAGGLEILDKITDKVLSYRPKDRKKKPHKRKKAKKEKK